MTYEEKVSWLRRYQESLRREQELAEEVERLRSEATRITPLLSGMPGGPGDGQKVPRAVERIVEAQQQLERQVELCESERQKIVSLIERIENPLECLVLRKKYILGQTIEKIACDIGFSTRWCIEIHKKGVCAIKIGLDI